MLRIRFAGMSSCLPLLLLLLRWWLPLSHRLWARPQRSVRPPQPQRRWRSTWRLWRSAKNKVYNSVEPTRFSNHRAYIVYVDPRHLDDSALHKLGHKWSYLCCPKTIYVAFACSTKAFSNLMLYDSNRMRCVGFLMQLSICIAACIEAYCCSSNNRVLLLIL